MDLMEGWADWERRRDLFRGEEESFYGKATTE